MKHKILFLTFILLNLIIYSQEISPYFPSPYFSATDNKYETQITYFDLNFVNLKIQNFMSRKFAMTQDDSKFDLKEGKGTITEIFTDQIAINRQPRKLNFAYNVFPIENIFVVKSLKITGDADVVLGFYVWYWSTNLNFEDVSKKEIVSNMFLQDRISYSFNNGHSYIEVHNTTIENDSIFIQEFQEKKIEYDKQQEEIAAQKELEKLKKQEELDRKKNTKKSNYIYKVVKKKKTIKIEQTNSYKLDKFAESINLEQKLIEFINDQKVGTYTINVVYKTVYGVIEETNFEIKKYEKPRGFLDVVDDVIRY